MLEYAIDNRRIMERAYAALAAGDLRGFVKPLAPKLVNSALEEVLHPFAVDVDDLRIDPREVTVAPDRVIVTGRYWATRRGDRVGLAAAFRHEWHMTYGVAWRLVQESWGLTESRASEG